MRCVRRWRKRLEFETAIKLYPNHDKSYYNLGVVYHQKGNLKKAMENHEFHFKLDDTSCKSDLKLNFS